MVRLQLEEEALDLETRQPLGIELTADPVSAIEDLRSGFRFGTLAYAVKLAWRRAKDHARLPLFDLALPNNG